MKILPTQALSLPLYTIISAIAVIWVVDTFFSSTFLLNLLTLLRNLLLLSSTSFCRILVVPVCSWRQTRRTNSWGLLEAGLAPTPTHLHLSGRDRR